MSGQGERHGFRTETNRGLLACDDAASFCLSRSGIFRNDVDRSAHDAFDTL